MCTSQDRWPRGDKQILTAYLGPLCLVPVGVGPFVSWSCRPPIKSEGKFHEMKKFFDPFFSGECLSLPFKDDFLKERG